MNRTLCVMGGLLSVWLGAAGIATAMIAADTVDRRTERECASALPRLPPGRVRGTDEPRVRPKDLLAAELLLEGLQRSPTLRKLVDDLQESDVVVYISVRPFLRDRIGSLHWLTAAANLRYLHASIGPAPSRLAWLAAIGHELQHAREVADAPEVVDGAAFAGFYGRIGERVRADGDAWDTQAAFETGVRIRREVAKAALGVRPMRPSRPADWFEVYRCERTRLGDVEATSTGSKANVLMTTSR
jgi:hypothetical protein